MALGDLYVRVGAKIDGFRSAMREVSSTLGGVTSDMGRFSNMLGSGFSSAARSFGLGMTAGVTTPLTAIGLGSIKAAADMESLKMALTAITGSSKATESQLASLAKVAELPGLGFKEAVQGSVNLQAAGFSAQLAERSLRAFGNALATVGKGKADLDGVNLVLTQIINKPSVMAQDLNQLRERLPQISQMMKAAFGSSVSEDIQKLGITGREFVEKMVSQFERLPKVTAGFKNSAENLSDLIFKVSADVGKALLPVATRATEMASTAVAGLGRLAKAFEALPGPVQTATLAVIGFIAAAGPLAFIGSKAYVGLSAMSTFFKELAAQYAGAKAAQVAFQNSTIGLGGTLTTYTNNFTSFSGAVAGAGTAVSRFSGVLKGIGIIGGVAALGVAIYETGNYFVERFSSGVDRGTDALRRFNDAAKESQQYRLQMAGGAPASGHATINALLGSFELIKAAADIDGALRGLGLKSTRELRKELDEARKNFEKLRAAGTEAPAVMEAAAKRVKDAYEALYGTVKQFEFVGPIFQSDNTEFMVAQARDWAEASRKARFEFAEFSATGTIGGKLLGDEISRNVEFTKLLGLTAMGSLPAVAAIAEVDMGSLRESVVGTDEAMKSLGLTSTRALQAAYDAALKTAQQIARLRDEGKATDSDLSAAMGKVAETHRDLSQRVNDWGVKTQKAKRTGADFGREVSLAFNDVTRSVADLIWSPSKGLKGLGDAFQQVGRNITRVLLDDVVRAGIGGLKGALSSVMKDLGGFGSTLGKLFGGGASAAANWGGDSMSMAGGVTKTASSAGSAAGAVSGLAGTLTAIGSLGSMVSGVIGNFQFAGMNKSLDVLVNHTLRIFNEVFQQRIDHWHQFNQTFTRLGEIWNSIQAQSAGKGATFDFRGSTFNGMTQQQADAFMQAAYRKTVLALG